MRRLLVVHGLWLACVLGCGEEAHSPRTLVIGLNTVFALAVDDESLYWTTRGNGPMGSVQKLLHGSKTVEVLATAQSQPSSLALDGSSVFWTQDLAGKVMRVARGGGAEAELLHGGENGVFGITHDAGRLFWVNRADRLVRRRTLTEASPVTVAYDAEGPERAAALGDRVFWVTSGGSVKRKDGEAEPVELARVEGRPQSLVVDDAFAYWSTETAVYKVPVEGGAPVPVAGEQDLPQSLTRYGEDLNWVNRGGGQVMRASGRSSALAVLAEGQETPIALAVDGKAVYWTVFGDGIEGKVIRLEK